MIRNVDALRDDQWERLKDLVPGGGKSWPARAALRQPALRRRAVVDGPLGRALARSARTLRRASGREAPLLSLDRARRARRLFARAHHGSRSRMADDRLDTHPA